jgi:hypothetical protein
MAAKMRTDFEGEGMGEPYGLHTDAPMLDELERVSPVPLEPTDVYFYPLPNFEQDRRFDTRSRGKSRRLPFEDGYLSDFEKIAKPGHYYVEYRAGNQILKDPKGFVHEVRPQVTFNGPPHPHVYQPSAAQPAQQYHAQQQTASGTTEAVTTARELVGLAKDLNPPPPSAPPLTREDIAQMIAAAAAQVKASEPATTERPKSTLDTLREVKEAAELLGMGAAQREPPDMLELYLKTHERMREVAEVVAPRTIGDDASSVEKITAIIDAAGRALPSVISTLMPILPARIQALISGHPDAADVVTPPPSAPTPGAQPQPSRPQAPAQPQNDQEALALIMAVGAADLSRNKRPGRTADLIEEMGRRFPTIAASIEQIVNMSPAEVLATIEQLSGRTDLSAFNHSCEWVASLQDELRVEDDEEQPEPEGSEHAPNIIHMAEQARAS